MSQPAEQSTEAGVRCEECGKSFKNYHGLINHALAKRHFRCEPCQRVFKTSAELKRHLRCSPNHRPPRIYAPTRPVVERFMSAEQELALSVALLNLAAGIEAISTSPVPVKPIAYKDNTYTSLSAHNAAALQALLLQHCHTPHHLNLEGYVLPGDFLTSQAKKDLLPPMR